jgi:hypothetical protein
MARSACVPAALLACLLIFSVAPNSAGENDACNIKGNVSTQGERIYHVPGDKYYDETRISASHGERWFCSEEEARAAGWRRARV